MVDSKDISIVVQGPVYNIITKNSLKSLRKYLPNSQIILSTYQGSKVKDLDYDVIVLNKDPGATIMFTTDSTRSYNIRRQIITTQSGLKKVTRKYTMKFRTDFILTGNKFLDYFDKFPQRCHQWQVTKARIIMPMGTHPYWRPYHPTDVICFGVTEDMKLYWGCKVPSEEFCHYFLKHRQPLKSNINLAIKIGAEMYLWSEMLRKFENKFGKINFKNSFHNSKENIELSKLTIANNTIILDRNQFQFETPKHQYLFDPNYKETWIDHSLWKLYYIKFCLPYSKKNKKIMIHAN